MSTIGVISPPQRTSPVPSNCKITQDGNVITLTDDATTRPFIESQEFDAVTQNFTDVINEVSTNDSMRIISFGSEFSTPNITQIREWSIQLINQRFQANPSQSIPISAGLVYDNDVLDLLSLRSEKSEKFELVDSDDIYSAIDLIGVSFEKFKRFKESVFVLHIGIEPFFEWVVVPRADHFVPTPSLTGLPPNEKLIFILKQFPTITESGITTGFDRFRRMSNIFKLVLDTFCDIQTLWVFHFATDVTFKSNNALFKIAGYVKNIQTDSGHFQISRSNLFDVHQEEEEVDFKGLNPDLLSGYLTDQQRKDAEAEGEELEKRLNMRSEGKGRKRKVGKKKNDKGEYEYEYEYENGPFGSKSGRKIKKRRSKKNPDGTNEYYDYYEYVDGENGSDDENIDGKGRRRRKKKSGNNKDGYSYDSDYLEDDELDVIGELNKRKQNRSKKGKGKGKGEGGESTDGEGKEDDPVTIAKKAAEEEARAKKAAEKEARDQKIKELLDKRKQGKKKTDESDKEKQGKKKGKKGKQSTSNFSNGSSMMSQRDKINMMMQKFRNQLAREGSDDFDDFDAEEEEEDIENMSFLNFDKTGMTHDQIQNERRRRLEILKEKKRREAIKKRRENEHELLRLQMLAVNGLALARRADPNQVPLINQAQKGGINSMNDSNDLSQYTRQQPVTASEMQTKDGEIVEELDKVEEIRNKRVDELLALNKKLNDKRRKHEKYQSILKERRALFLDIHNSIVQMKMEAPPPRVDVNINGDEEEDLELGDTAGGKRNKKGGASKNANDINSSKLGNKTGGKRNRKGNAGNDDLNSTDKGTKGKQNRKGNNDNNKTIFTGSAKLDRAIARRKVYDSSKSKKKVNHSEYEQTKMLLLREIATVKKEIELIKRRKKAINHEI